MKLTMGMREQLDNLSKSERDDLVVQVLANDVTRKILVYLHRTDVAMLKDIHEYLGLAQSMISAYVKMLVKSGLVKREKVGVTIQLWTHSKTESIINNAVKGIFD